MTNDSESPNEGQQQMEKLPENESESSSVQEKKEGFDYVVVPIVFKQGMKFGLGIKNVYKNIYVIKVEENSMVSGLFNIADRVINVDGEPVVDNTKCKTLLIKGLKKNHISNVLVERAITETTKQNALDEMNEIHKESVMAPPDVRSIMRKMKQRIRIKPQESALTKEGKDRKACIIDDGHKSVMIHMDNEGQKDKLKVFFKEKLPSIFLGKKKYLQKVSRMKD